MILSALCIVGLAFSAAPLADTAACIPHVIHGNQIVGHGARTCQGEYVGRVTDIIIAPQENRISHVLISDVQLRLVVVPWEAVTVRLDDGIIVNATLDRLGQGPFLSFDDWGNLSDPQWQAHVRTSFGLSPYADPAVAMSG